MLPSAEPVPPRTRSPAPGPAPDPALRDVLARFVAAWARGALGSAAGPEPGAASPSGVVLEHGPPRRLVYVDAFAGSEWHLGVGDPSARGPSRAAAAVRALVAAVDAVKEPVDVYAVLVEEDPALLDRLRTELGAAGLGGRMRHTRDVSALAPGEIALVEADFAAVSGSLPALAGGDARSLFWLAPPAARRLPWEALRPVPALPGADALLRFPHADFEKQATFPVPLADLPPFMRRVVEGCSALLGDPRHDWILAWRAVERAGGLAAALEEVAGRFRARLEGAAEGVRVETARIGGAEGDAVFAWLFAATADPARALALDAAIRGIGSGPVPGPAVPSAPPAPSVPSAPSSAVATDSGEGDPPAIDARHGDDEEDRPLDADRTGEAAAEPDPPPAEVVLDLFGDTIPREEKRRAAPASSTKRKKKAADAEGGFFAQERAAEAEEAGADEG